MSILAWLSQSPKQIPCYLKNHVDMKKAEPGYMYAGFTNHWQADTQRSPDCFDWQTQVMPSKEVMWKSVVCSSRTLAMLQMFLQQFMHPYVCWIKHNVTFSRPSLKALKTMLLTLHTLCRAGTFVLINNIKGGSEVKALLTSAALINDQTAVND